MGVYIHWPYCARICPYCDFNVVRHRGGEQPAALAQAMLADLERQRALTGPRQLRSIFFGGGTPSLMEPDQAGAMIEACKRLWDAEPGLEISLEANPTDAESDRFAGFADAGVNRLSLGLQSLDDDALRFLGRNHDAAQAARAAGRAAIFPRLSLDLIYARPGQTPAAWRDELNRALDLGPEHLSPYQLTIEHGTAFDRAVKRGTWAPPDPDTGAELFETTQGVLEAAGFDAYEVSNHARGEAARSRHNLVYWQGHDYVGVGPGAHGRLTLEGVRSATRAPDRIGDYLADAGFEREPLTPVEAAEERLLMGLRIDAGVGREEIAPLAIPEDRIAGLVEAGLLADDPLRIRATRAGRLVLDRVTEALIV